MTQVLFSASKQRADMFAEKRGWRKCSRGYQDATGQIIHFAQDSHRLRGMEISKLFVLEEGTEQDLIKLGLRIGQTELAH